MNKLEKYHNSSKNCTSFKNGDFVAVLYSDHQQIVNKERIVVPVYNKFDLLMKILLAELSNTSVSNYYICVYILEDILGESDTYVDGAIVVDNILFLDLEKLPDSIAYADMIDLDIDLLKTVLGNEEFPTKQSALVRTPEIEIFNKYSDIQLSYYQKPSSMVLRDALGIYKHIATPLIISASIAEYYLILFGQLPHSHILFSVKEVIRICDYRCKTEYKGIVSVYSILLDTIARDNGVSTLQSITDKFVFENGKKTKKVLFYKKKFIEPFNENVIKIGHLNDNDLEEDEIVENTVFVGANLIFDKRYKFRTHSEVFADSQNVLINHLTPYSISYDKRRKISVVTGIREIFSRLFYTITLYIQDFKKNKLPAIEKSIELLCTFLTYKIHSKKRVDKSAKKAFADLVGEMKSYLEKYIEKLSQHFTISTDDNVNSEAKLFSILIEKMDNLLFGSLHYSLIEEINKLWKDITGILTSSMSKNTEEELKNLFTKVDLLSNKTMTWINEDFIGNAFTSEKTLIEHMTYSKFLLLFLVEKLNKEDDDYEQIEILLSDLNKKEDEVFTWRHQFEKEMKILFRKNEQIYDGYASLLENVHMLMSIQKEDDALKMMLSMNFREIAGDLRVFSSKWKEYYKASKLLVMRHENLVEYEGTLFESDFYKSLMDFHNEPVNLMCEQTDNNILSAFIMNKASNFSKKKVDKKTWELSLKSTYDNIQIKEGVYFDNFKKYQSDLGSCIEYVSDIMGFLKQMNMRYSYIKKDYDFLQVISNMLTIYEINELSIDTLISVIGNEIVALAEKYEFIKDKKTRIVCDMCKVGVSHGVLPLIILESTYLQITQEFRDIEELHDHMFLMSIIQAMKVLFKDTSGKNIPLNLTLNIAWYCSKIMEFYNSSFKKDAEEEHFGAFLKKFYITDDSSLAVDSDDFGNILFGDKNIRKLSKLYN
jgi:hypothetical protein